MRILTAGQMREADRQTIEDIGLPSLVLMENAGREVAAAMGSAFPGLRGQRVAILAGRGNNGGDGFVIARTLRQRGVDVRVFVVGALADVRGDARVNLDILARLGMPVVEIGGEPEWALHAPEVRRCSLVVDALFGTGLERPLTGLHEAVVTGVNGMGLPVVSVDLPSGLSADAAAAIGPCIHATLTVTLAAPKLPLVLAPGCSLAGRLVVADIGIPAEVVERLGGPRVELLTRARVRPLVPARRPDAHKGDFGHVLVVAGSVGKTGAAHLAATGALRSGAGLVTVATPRCCQPIVATLGAEYMTDALPDSPEGTLGDGALERVLAGRYDVVAVGPGLGTTEPVRRFVRALVERAAVPLVLDADAISAFAGEAGLLAGRANRAVVITPHPGELARLLGTTVAGVQARRVESARDLATSRGLHVVLKGHQTVIATPGGRVLVNTTGNPGMATGGTGDVLAGMIAAWLAVLDDAEAACALGAYLHGAAGDLAAADQGAVSMTAADLARRIGDAVRELTAERHAADEA